MSKRCLGCMEIYGDEFNICPHCGFVEGSVSEEPIHMNPGTILHDRYIIGKVLGFGGFGVTYLAWDGRLEQKVAIKEYLPGEFSTRMPGQTTVTVFNGEKTEQFYSGLHKFVDEAKRLAKFQNEAGIVTIFDSFETNKTAYIVMEYLEGETLAEYLKRVGTIPEDQAVEMLMPIMESLITVHEEGLLHRDIAPDNIFLTTTGEVKLIDFGASRYATTTHSRSLTVIVKPGYSPEEQYRSRGDQGKHTDVYSVAATLYKMITGKTPPDAMERRAKYENQNKDILVEPHKLIKKISVNREIAILNALNVRIEDRTPDITSLIEELNADPPAKRRYGKIRKIDVYSWPLWVKIAVPSVMALLITLGVLILTGVISFSKYTKDVVVPDYIVIAPDVEGMVKSDAEMHIKNARLNAVISGSVESEFIAAGKILVQRPVGGTFLEKNGTVNLTISAGSGVQPPENGMSTVPYFIGDEKDKAISKCRMAGLGEPQFEEVEDELIAAGLVVSSSEEADEKVPEGTVLVLKISKGPAPFPMPSVSGSDAAQAISILEDSGLMVSVEYANSDTVPEGSVISQSVDPGENIRKGARITLVVSSGEELIRVNDVMGKTSDEAKKQLEAQGFTVNVMENYNISIPAGMVINQTPEAGSTQKKGTTITIFVSKGPEPTPTPVPVIETTTQSTQETAKETEPKATATPIPTPTSTPVPTQTPTPTPTPAPVAIPNVVGKTQSEAETSLTSAGFVVDIKEEYSKTVDRGVVISQNPSSGTAVPGSSVTIVVSLGTEKIAPTAMELNVGSMKLNVLETQTLKPVFTPEDTTEKSLTWSSSDPKVATVDSYGEVTAVAPGNVTITATSSANPSLTASCEVTVNSLVVKGDEEIEIHFEKGETEHSLTVYTAKYANVKWSTSDSDVATIREIAVGALDSTTVYVTFVGRGTATITATVELNGATSTHKCLVKCYDNVAVYSDWGERKYSTSPITESDTRMADGDAEVEIEKRWYVRMDYYLYTVTDDRKYYPSKQSSGSLTWNWSANSNGGYLLEAYSSDGGATPSGWIVVPPGGYISGDGRGHNRSNVNGYRGPDGSGYESRIFFVKDSYYQSITEHRYYYRDRTVSYVPSCEKD